MALCARVNENLTVAMTMTMTMMVKAKSFRKTKGLSILILTDTLPIGYARFALARADAKANKREPYLMQIRGEKIKEVGVQR